MDFTLTGNFSCFIWFTKFHDLLIPMIYMIYWYQWFTWFTWFTDTNDLLIQMIYMIYWYQWFTWFTDTNENHENWYSTKKMASIGDLMVVNALAEPVNGYLRPSNQQLMPWNFQIQYSYLHSNAILNIKMYSCISLGLKITQIKIPRNLVWRLAHKQHDIIWRLPV